MIDEGMDKEYKTFLKNAGRSKEPNWPIIASCPKNIKGAISLIIETTKKELKILANDMNDSFLNDPRIIGYLKQAYRRGVGIIVIIENYKERDKEFLNFVKERKIPLYNLEGEDVNSNIIISCNERKGSFRKINEYGVFVGEKREKGMVYSGDMRSDTARKLNNIFDKQFMPNSTPINYT